MGIHWWTSLPSPCVLETPDGPPAYLGGLMPAQTGAQRVAHRVGRLLVRAFKLGGHRLHRRQMTSLGLPALYRSDGSEAAYSPECILALGVPELEFERRWPAALRFVGPMLCTPPGCQREPSFEAGRRHVLVTCGTHLDWAKNRLCTAAKDLARRYPDWVVHFSEGRVDGQGTGESDHPTNFHRFAFVDYERSLPRYDLVVHHGGAGVMYHALQAGIPSIVYPLDYDQFDHAARLHAERAGIWLRRLDDLPTAFDCIIRRAESIAGLPGLQQAVLRKVAQRQTLAIANCLQCEDMGVNEPSPKR
jgi:UDP:flavonoid glycosyltransferase YjiC (YdhE family)